MTPRTTCLGIKYILTQLHLDYMAAISHTIFSDAFSWMKTLYFDDNFTPKFVPKSRIYSNPALVKIMIWREIGDKLLLSEPMLIRFTDAYMRH